ncbi:methionyl-tRNA formyltransferase [Candidatus Daviesbacteria bacterium]|nr:methionyl-tRNA formyltransferase [Candidatus Daviesbacteria bacterium]
MTKILFIGGREKGLKTLEELIKQGGKVSYSYILEEDEHEVEKFSAEIADFCKKRNIGFTITKSIKGKEEEIKKLNPDLIVVSGWRTLIPPSVIYIPKLGTVALHESLLPKYRGFAPINWALINGEKYTGVSLFYITEGIDDGDIIAQEKIEIGPNETAFEIYKKSINTCVVLIRKYYPLIISKRASRTKQNEKEATYLCVRTPDDGRINWMNSAVNIHNLIRGLSHPYPGAFCFHKGIKITIQKSEIPKQLNWVGRIPGRIVSIKRDFGMEVLTGDGSILITSIEVDKKIYNPADYFKSIKDILV